MAVGVRGEESWLDSGESSASSPGGRAFGAADCFKGGAIDVALESMADLSSTSLCSDPSSATISTEGCLSFDLTAVLAFEDFDLEDTLELSMISTLGLPNHDRCDPEELVRLGLSSKASSLICDVRLGVLVAFNDSVLLIARF